MNVESKARVSKNLALGRKLLQKSPGSETRGDEEDA
jgi:hypothetical protein